MTLGYECRKSRFFTKLESLKVKKNSVTYCQFMPGVDEFVKSCHLGSIHFLPGGVKIEKKFKNRGLTVAENEPPCTLRCSYNTELCVFNGNAHSCCQVLRHMAICPRQPSPTAFPWCIEVSGELVRSTAQMWNVTAQGARQCFSERNHVRVPVNILIFLSGREPFNCVEKWSFNKTMISHMGVIHLPSCPAANLSMNPLWPLSGSLPSYGCSCVFGCWSC